MSEHQCSESSYDEWIETHELEVEVSQAKLEDWTAKYNNTIVELMNFMYNVVGASDAQICGYVLGLMVVLDRIEN
jgi:hypothetical protein